MAVARPPQLLTAEECLLLPDTDRFTELVRGVIVTADLRGFRHGMVCGRICGLVGKFVAEAAIGRLISNNSGVITQRNPDTVRAPDFAFYSFQRLPKEVCPVGYADVGPDVVFEVVSDMPGNNRLDVILKIAEFFDVNVNVVCIVYPNSRSVDLHYPDRAPRVLEQPGDLLSFDELRGFALPIARLFS